MLDLDEPGAQIRLLKKLRPIIDYDIVASLARLFGAQLRAGRVAQWVAIFEA